MKNGNFHSLRSLYALIAVVVIISLPFCSQLLSRSASFFILNDLSIVFKLALSRVRRRRDFNASKDWMVYVDIDEFIVTPGIDIYMIRVRLWGKVRVRVLTIRIRIQG